MRRRSQLTGCAFALALLGCGPKIDVVVVPNSVKRGPDASADASASVDAGSGPCAYRARAAAASGSGATLDEILAQNVTRALCTCNGITTSSSITTRSALADGGFDASPVGGVGINDALSIGANSEIGGALVVKGSGGIMIVNPVELRVHGDLAVGGPLAGPASVIVGGNAAVAGRVQLDALDLSGQLTQPSGASYVVPHEAKPVARRTATIEVQPPCACDASSALDVTAFAEPAKQKLNATATEAAQLDLACGEYTLARYASTNLKLSVHAPAALYVAGDLHLTGDLTIELADRADLDLFIAGNLKIDGQLRAGDAAHAARVRIFVADSGTLPLANGGELHGLLYAPGAELVLDGPLSVDGALVLGRVSATAPLSVVYE